MRRKGDILKSWLMECRYHESRGEIALTEEEDKEGV